MENDGIVPTWSGQQGPDAGAWLPACEVEDACTDLLDVDWDPWAPLDFGSFDLGCITGTTDDLDDHLKAQEDPNKNTDGLVPAPASSIPGDAAVPEFRSVLPPIITTGGVTPAHSPRTPPTSSKYVVPASSPMAMQQGGGPCVTTGGPNHAARGPGGGTSAAGEAVVPTRPSFQGLLSAFQRGSVRQGRHAKLARYREKRARRKLTGGRVLVQYESRKRYAEIRPRIKGRFVSPEEYAAYQERHSSGPLHAVPK